MRFRLNNERNSHSFEFETFRMKMKVFIRFTKTKGGRENSYRIKLYEQERHEKSIKKVEQIQGSSIKKIMVSVVQ